MLETLHSYVFHLRMAHRRSIGFKSGDMLGQSSTFTLSLFIKALFFLEVCLGLLSCCPVAQFLKGGDHALLQYGTVRVGIQGSLN